MCRHGLRHPRRPRLPRPPGLTEERCAHQEADSGELLRSVRDGPRQASSIAGERPRHCPSRHEGERSTWRYPRDPASCSRSSRDSRSVPTIPDAIAVELRARRGRPPPSPRHRSGTGDPGRAWFGRRDPRSHTIRRSWSDAAEHVAEAAQTGTGQHPAPVHDVPEHHGSALPRQSTAFALRSRIDARCAAPLVAPLPDDVEAEQPCSGARRSAERDRSRGSGASDRP